MSLEEKAEAVEQVLKDLDVEISSFQSWSGLHCLYGCGKCCHKADIEATPLEFLPFALYIYKQGQGWEWLERLRGQSSSICLILNPTQQGAGLCSEYIYRGLICRLFGYSARTNKYGKKELVTCQPIKTEHAYAYQTAQKSVETGKDIPVMNEFYMRLVAIDHERTQQFYPINEAIKQALEWVMGYYAYRD
jgi:uncharacterized protein